LLSYVEENPGLIQRKKPVLIGNNSKLKAIGWKAKTSFEEMVIKMYNNVI
jgi:GDP-D-mannose dehydratase